jgi:hypothetical protein
MAGRAGVWVVLVIAIATLAVAWWLGTVWLSSTDASLPVVVDREVAASAPDPGIPALPPAPPMNEPHPERSELASEAPPDAEPAFTDVPVVPVLSSQVGLLAFTAVDAETGSPLREVTLRCGSESRFAATQSPGRVQVTLKPGCYLGCVTAAGYDPATLPVANVIPGQVTELGKIAMQIGRGAIEGRVLAPSDERVIRVELYGSGRNRCRSCSVFPTTPETVRSERRADLEGRPTLTFEHAVLHLGGSRALTPIATEVASRRERPSSHRCPDCGYGDDRSVLETQPGSRGFRFPELAAGTYFLRAVDEDDHSSVLVKVTVPPQQPVWTEIALAPSARAVFELQDESGRPFEGAWLALDGKHTLHSSIIYRFLHEGHEVGTAIVTQRIGHGVLSLTSGVRPGFYLRLKMFPGVTKPTSDDEGFDRERMESDSLAVEPQEPELPPSSFTVREIAGHVHEITGLPYASLTYTVTCGLFESGERPLELRSSSIPHETVVMRRRELQEGEAEPGVYIIEDGDSVMISGEGVSISFENPPSSGG